MGPDARELVFWLVDTIHTCCNACFVHDSLCFLEILSSMLSWKYPCLKVPVRYTFSCDTTRMTKDCAPPSPQKTSGRRILPRLHIDFWLMILQTLRGEAYDIQVSRRHREHPLKAPECCTMRFGAIYTNTTSPALKTRSSPTCASQLCGCQLHTFSRPLPPTQWV